MNALSTAPYLLAVSILRLVLDLVFLGFGDSKKAILFLLPYIALRISFDERKVNYFYMSDI
jgi:hypothetical protein